jgi:predicted Zn-dependent peptidase
MFLNVREAQGLCYYVRTETDHFTDTGTISTRAGVDTKRVKDALTAIVKEYRDVLENGPTEEEIHNAKQYLKGKITLRLEDSEEFAHMIGRQELLKNDILSPEQVIEKIDSITLDNVNDFLQKYFSTENLYMALIGPYSDTEEFKQILQL